MHFWLTRVNKVSLCNDPPASVDRLSNLPTIHHKLNMDNISDTINSRVMKLDQKVVCDKTFKTMQVKMTLTQGQGHRVNLKCWKFEHSLISRTLLTVGLWKLDWKVVCDKIFQSMQVKMTLHQGQGHRVNLKCRKIEHLLISRTLLTVELYKLDQKVVCDKTFKSMQVKMTLT